MVWTLWLVACGTEEPVDTAVEDTSDDGGACGAVTTWDVEIRAAVVDADDAPLPGVTVSLEERAWDPGVLGSGVTDADGLVTFTAGPVTSVEDCWGTALDYWIVADDGAGAVAEDEMNPELHAAVDDGSLVVDRTDRPLILGQ